MKKKLAAIGLCCLVCLLVGAIAVEVVEAQKRVIRNWSELLFEFESKNTTPPLPDMEPETTYKMIQAKDFSFMKNERWFRVESGGTYYVSKNAKELQHLKLPVTIRVYDYLPTESVYILSSPDGTNFTSEAAFESEPLTNEAFEKLTTEEQRSDLLFELWRKRCIWEVTLKDESELLGDLFKVEEASSLLFSGRDAATTLEGGMMMRSGAPPAHTNDIWLQLENLTNGNIELQVFAPDQYTNIEAFSIGSLVSNQWSLVATNLNPTSPTNPATVTVGESDVKIFRAITFDDADGDGLSTGLERYTYGTDEDDPDTDGDGYSDGSAWPTGYSNAMRGLNDAFPNDAAAWRDTDGDGLPNEVVGDSELEEDFDDDGDGTNEMSVAGIWISAEEISGLATNGVPWENLLDEANQQIYTVDISDQDEFDDVYTMAKALVYARTGNSIYKTDVIDACADAIGTEEGGSSLAFGRNLAAFVIAADLVDLPQADDMLFRDWLRASLTNVMVGDERSLTICHEDRPNNWGTHAGGSRAAIAAYLQDWDELARVAKVFKGWMGDTNSYSDFKFVRELAWQSNTNAPVGINPLGATLSFTTNGTTYVYNVDGVLPDDQRRSASNDIDFVWHANSPPPWDPAVISPTKENYVYEALQGALMQAVILDRAGYDVWEWEDRALLRAFNWLHDEANFTAVLDDSWEPFLMNHFYETDFPTFPTSEHGKNVAPTCWLYPDGDPELDLEFYSDNYSNATIIGNSLPSTWRPFTNTSPWNTPIPENATVHSNSAEIMSLITNRVDHIRLADSQLTPIWVVNSSNALAVSTNTSPGTNLIWTYMNSSNLFYAWDADTNGVSDDPIPLSSEMNPSSEGYLCIIDPFKRLAYELSDYHGWTNDTPECGAFHIWNLTENGVGQNPTNLTESQNWQTQGTKGSGLCLIGGVLRPEELEAREIRHALTFSFGLNRDVENGQIMMYPPACRSDGMYTNNPPDEIYPIEGMRFQLDPSLGTSDFDEWGITNRRERVFARALQDYGMVLGDTGEDMAIAVQQLGTNAAASRAEWERLLPEFYNLITNIPTSAFRVIDTGQEVIEKYFE